MAIDLLAIQPHKVSRDLMEYIIKQARVIDKNEKIKLTINKSSDIKINSVKLIIAGLKDEFKISKQQHYHNNIEQIYLLLLGIILLFIATRINVDVIWKEILLISGWVPIWEMVKLELFPDVEGRIKRRIIRRLIRSEIVERI